MIRRYISHYIRKCHELLDAKDAPHSIAGGTAIGVFFGFVPIFGLKTLCAMGTSMLTHPHHLPPRLRRGDFRPSEIFQWDNFLDIGLPLAVGGVIFAIPASLITYAVVLLVMKARKARRKKLEKKPELIDKAWEQP